MNKNILLNIDYFNLFETLNKVQKKFYFTTNKKHMNKNLLSNIDYFNLFETLNKVQKKFSLDLFTRIIKFNNPDKIWDIYVSNGNNMMLFFDALTLTDKICFIKFFDYEIKNTEELKTLLIDKCNEINNSVNILKLKDKNESLTKIEIIEAYDLFYHKYNNERIIIDNQLTYYHESVSESVDNKILLDFVIEWIEEFFLDLSNYHPEIYDSLDLKKENFGIDAREELNKAMNTQMKPLFDQADSELFNNMVGENYEKMKEKRIEENSELNSLNQSEAAFDVSCADNDMFGIKNDLDAISISKYKN